MTREEIIQGLYRGDSRAIKEAIKTLEQQPCKDTISRADAVRVASGYCHPSNIAKELAKLPPVTPKPCEDAVSRQAINELFDSEIKMYKERIETRKGSNYYDQTERIKEFRSRIANAEYWQNKIEALPPVTPKTDVLDKVKAEIKALSPEPTAYDVVDGNPIKDAVWETLADVLRIIDKYKGESGGTDAGSD